MKMFKRRAFFKGFKKFSGNDKEICKQIVAQCFNGTYFQTSQGHFNIFYLRDFAFCIESLIKLGYADEVCKTLEYALHCYATNKKLATTISSDGKPFDVFTYAVDSLPLLFHSLFILEKHEAGKGKEFVEIYKPWLELEIKKFFDLVIDPSTGLIKRNNHFSSIKDHAKRSVSCYDVCMCGLLSVHLDFFELANPLKNFKYPTLIKEYFWKNDHFVDSLGSNVISGDANVFPYWTGLITDKKMINWSIAAIQQEGLDKPFPLKYTQSNEGNFLFPLSLFAGNYEGNSVWMHLGLCYLDVVEKVDKQFQKQYLQTYKKQIEKHKTFLEVFDTEGKAYNTLFYIADEGMLWAAKYLAL